MYNVWHQDEDLQIQLEWAPELPSAVFIHVHIYNWCLDTAYKLYTLAEKLNAELSTKNIVHAFTYNKNQDKKWRKFLKMYGFSKAFQSADGLDVYVRKVV